MAGGLAGTSVQGSEVTDEFTRFYRDQGLESIAKDVSYAIFKSYLPFVQIMVYKCILSIKDIIGSDSSKSGCEKLHMKEN